MYQNNEIMEQRSWNLKHNKPQNLQVIELAELQNYVITIFCRNKIKYQNIMKMNSNFQTDLYEPKEIIKVDKALHKQILIKQLDKVMDQEAFFDKKLTHLKFEKQEQNKKINKFLQQKINPYQILTQVWKIHKKAQFSNSEQKLESLNFTIGRIKSTILAMKKIQEKEEKTQFRSIQSINETGQTQKYNKLNQMYTDIQVTNKKLQQGLVQLRLKFDQKVKQNNILNDKLLTLEKQLRTQKKSKEQKQIDFAQKLQISKLKENIFNIQKKYDKLQKWKKILQQKTYENLQKGLKIYIQNNQNISKPMQMHQKVIINKQFQEIDNFLRVQNQQQKVQNYEIELSQISQLVIPELKDCGKKSQLSTDRTSTRHNGSDNSIGSYKISFSNNNDEGPKKFIRRSQLDLDKVQPSSY